MRVAMHKFRQHAKPGQLNHAFRPNTFLHQRIANLAYRQLSTSGSSPGTGGEQQSKKQPLSTKVAAATVAASCLLGLGTTLHAKETGLQAKEKVPPYNPDKTRWDDGTYMGRVQDMKEIIDPRTLFVSDAELKKNQEKLKSWDPKKTYSDAENEEFWAARKNVQAIVHPVTNEKMFILGRMSAFVPVNVPISSGMLIHGPTSMAAAAFWQFMNQTGNMFCNYANRSGAEIDMSKLLQAYGLAVGCSVAMAIGGGMLVKSVPFLQKFGLFIPYVSVCSASTANMFFTRMEEFQVGVPVYDADGNKLGISAKAGFEGIVQTVSTRGWVTPIPILLIPPIIMLGLRGAGLAGAPLVAAEITTITLCMFFALPYTLAIQPQTMILTPEKLEPKFHGLKDQSGKPITQIFANKGL